MDWSDERDAAVKEAAVWEHAGTNRLLDFHGDPQTAKLVIFSDGNHHMALKEVLDRFRVGQPEVTSIFYATTPPAPIVTLLEKKSLRLGNFILSAHPHLFIGPPHVLDRLVAEGHMAHHRPFIRNQGNVLLVKRGNPKGVHTVKDLRRPDVTVFLSNPNTETASYQSYADTLANLMGDPDAVRSLRIFHGERIHHREAPEAVADGRADAAVIFYHLALYFTRRFPDDFEIVPLGGTVQKPVPLEGNLVGHTHVGLIGDGGPFGRRFLDFLGTDTAMVIYRHHGLIPLSPIPNSTDVLP